VSKKVKYVQSTMRRSIATGCLRTTSYIPQRFAKVGGVVKLKDENGLWVDGWVVERTSDTAVEVSDVLDLHKAIRSHRKATGDSLPRAKS